MTADARRTPPARKRARAVAAAEEILAERGAHEVTLEAVGAAAGIPRPAVCSLFADRGELVSAVFERLTATVSERMGCAYRGEPTWADGVRAAILSLLEYFESEPAIARFLIVESMHDERLIASRSALIAHAARTLQADAPPIAAGDSPAPFGSEAVVGTVVSVLHGRLLEDPVPPLRALSGPLMGLIVLPFLGAEASRAELGRLMTDAA